MTSTTGARLFRRITAAPNNFRRSFWKDGSLIWAATAAQNQHSTHLAPPGYLVYKRRSDPGTQSVSSASTKFHSQQQHQQTTRRELYRNNITSRISQEELNIRQNQTPRYVPIKILLCITSKGGSFIMSDEINLKIQLFPCAYRPIEMIVVHFQYI
jgi:hypothetical protein